MHELGLIVEVIERVDAIAEERKIKKIDKVVLQVGEYISVVPGMMKSVYKKSIPGTSLENAELELIITKPLAKCKKCGAEFNPFETGAECPDCRSDNYETITGNEFLIKEIVCEE